jgi:hypothetical protein
MRRDNAFSQDQMAVGWAMEGRLKDAAEKKGGGLLATADAKNLVRHFPAQILSSLSERIFCYFGGELCQGNTLFEKSTFKTVNLSASMRLAEQRRRPEILAGPLFPQCLQPGAVECSTETIARYIKK